MSIVHLKIVKPRWIFETFDFYLFLKFLQLEKETCTSKASFILYWEHQNSKWNSEIFCSGTQKPVCSSEGSCLNIIVMLQQRCYIHTEKVLFANAGRHNHIESKHILRVTIRRCALRKKTTQYVKKEEVSFQNLNSGTSVALLLVSLLFGK